MEFIFQISLVVLLVLLNGYFVTSEFSLVAVRKTRIDELARKGNISAKVLQGALKKLDSYISATQLGITLASLALGWIGEPAIAHSIEPVFGFLPFTYRYVTAHTLSVIIAFSLITFLHIVLGELAPKSLALQRSEATSLIVITPLVLFTKIFWPFIWFLNTAGQFILKMFGLQAPAGHQLVHSEEEIRMILSQSAQGGVIPSREVEMVNNVFRLGDTPVKYVMVSRKDITAFDSASPLKNVLKVIQRHPHSRFPVYEHTIDTVIGFIHIKEFYRELLQKGDNQKLSDSEIIRPIISIPESKKTDSVLHQMRKKKIHMAVVQNEYGSTSGIVTLQDIIESIVGEIEDEFEEVTVNMKKTDDGSYRIMGHTLLSDFNSKFALPISGQGYATIGGLLYGLLGHEPRIGDSVQIAKYKFQVEAIEGRRIKIIKLKIKPRKKK